MKSPLRFDGCDFAIPILRVEIYGVCLHHKLYKIFSGVYFRFFAKM